MSVTNFECQIAKGQIGRYLAGDAFSDEAIRQLEAHIGGCPECKAHLAERKRALQQMLGGKPMRAVVEVPESAEPVRPKVTPDAKWAEALAAAGAAGTSTETPAPRKKAKPAKEPAPAPAPKTIAKTDVVKSGSFTKPLAYALGLAGVLVGMSAFSRSGFDLLGPKASKSMTSKPEAVTPVVTPTVTTPTTNPTTPVSTTATNPATNPAPVTGTNPPASLPVTSTPVINPSTPVNSTAVEKTPIATTGTTSNPTNATVPTSTEKPNVPPPAPAPVPEQHDAKPVKTPEKAPVRRVLHRRAPQVHVTARRVVSRHAPKIRRARRVVRRTTHTNTVRVYDAAGNPIN